FFFFQAEDGIRDFHVTGVQTCALPILRRTLSRRRVGSRWLRKNPFKISEICGCKNVSPEVAMSKDSQWVAGINAVASAIEHDAENVREVLLEAGARNPRITEIEGNARRLGIEVRRVAQQALDGVAGGLRHQGAVARYE